MLSRPQTCFTWSTPREGSTPDERKSAQRERFGSYRRRTYPALGRAVRRRAERRAGPAVGQRPLRLAAGAVRPRRVPRARPRPARRRPAGRRRARPAARRPRRPRRRGPGRLVPADGRRRGRPHRPRARPARTSSAPSAASCAPAAAATTRWPPTSGCTCGTPLARSPARVAELETALIGPAERHRGTAMPGMTHLQHAQPVLLAHHLLAARARLQARRRAPRRLGRPRRAEPARGRCPGGFLAAARPGRRRRRARLPGAVRQLDRRRVATGTSSPSSASSRPCSASTCPASARRSASGRRPSSAGSSSTTATRPGRRSCRRRRTRTSPSWPAASPAGWSAT